MYEKIEKKIMKLMKEKLVARKSELIESINKDNELYKEKDLKYNLTTNGAMKVLSNLAPQASIKEADVKFLFVSDKIVDF